MHSKLKSYRVTKPHTGDRLQNFLKLQSDLGLSGKAVKKIIDSYGCRVNGKIEVFSSRKIVEGDQIQLDVSKSFQAAPAQMQILFESDTYLVINKPSGVVCEQESIEKLLKRSAFLVHRLDKETSGVLIIAKNHTAQREFEELFKTREVEKTYLALAQGEIKHSAFTVENYLGKKASYQGQAIWGAVSEPLGFYALTEFKCLRASKKASLLKCFPHTGRTHQIRVHLSELGHPIIGDGHYSRNHTCLVQGPRVLLHALSVSFKDPQSKEIKTFRADPPQDFLDLKDKLFA